MNVIKLKLSAARKLVTAGARLARIRPSQNGPMAKAVYSIQRGELHE